MVLMFVEPPLYMPPNSEPLTRCSTHNLTQGSHRCPPPTLSQGVESSPAPSMGRGCKKTKKRRHPNLGCSAQKTTVALQLPLAIQLQKLDLGEVTACGFFDDLNHLIDRCLLVPVILLIMPGYLPSLAKVHRVSRGLPVIHNGNRDAKLEHRCKSGVPSPSLWVQVRICSPFHHQSLKGCNCVEAVIHNAPPIRVLILQNPDATEQSEAPAPIHKKVP